MALRTSFSSVTAYFKSSVDCRHAIEELLEAGLSKADLQFDHGNRYPKAQAEAPVNETETVWEVVRDFFSAEVNTNVYEKETQGPDSYRVAGSPCHGGYAFDGDYQGQSSEETIEEPLSRAGANSPGHGVILNIDGNIDSTVLDDILERHNGKRGVALISGRSMT